MHPINAFLCFTPHVALFFVFVLFFAYDARTQKNWWYIPLFLILSFLCFLWVAELILVPRAGFGSIATASLAGIVGMYMLNVRSEAFPGMYKSYLVVGIVLVSIYAIYFSTYFSFFGIAGGMGVFSAVSLISDYYFPRT